MAVAVQVFLRGAVFLAAAALLLSCRPLIADYNIEAYRNATTLKAETVALVDKAGEPFSRHKEDVEALSIRIDAAKEFSAGMPYNELAARQWAVLQDPERNLYGGFVALWERQGRVGDTFRAEFRGQIAAAFDAIICLEANKQRASRCAVAAATP